MHAWVKLVNAELKMLIYLYIFAILMDQISAVNKDLNQPIPTLSKMNHIFGKNQTLQLPSINTVFMLYEI